MGPEQISSRILATGQRLLNPDPSTTSPHFRRALFRPLVDAAAAFAVFAIANTAVSCGPSSASPNPATFTVPYETPATAVIKALGKAGDQPVLEIATTSSPMNPDAVYKRTSSQAAWGLLAAAFSALAALNLALLRHLRRAYASPRARETKSR